MPQGIGERGLESVAIDEMVLAGVIGGTDMGVAGVAGVQGQLGFDEAEL